MTTLVSPPAPSVDPRVARDASDDQLMRMIESGAAEDALAALQDRYSSRVFRLVHSLVRDPQHSQELTYEVFAKVFFKSHRYRPETNFRAWLFEVARNHALSALRRRRVDVRPLHKARDDADDDPLRAVADQRVHREVEERELMQVFAAAVRALPDRYRDVFELCVQQGRSYRDAASLLSIPTGTVAIRIMRARQRLFQDLSRHFDRVRRPPACLQSALSDVS